MKQRWSRISVLVICMAIYGGIVGEAAATGPDIEIIFAGNPDDDGGPYWLPPGESAANDSTGYYTDRSRQEEDWILIKATVDGGEEDITSVELDWFENSSPGEDTTSVGVFDFSFNSIEDYWYIDTGTVRGFPTPDDEKYYSFNIKAFDSASDSASVGWRKTGPTWGDPETPRRWVQLNCQTEDIDYKPYYLKLGSFTEPMLEGYDRYRADRFNHDTGSNAGSYDVGALLPDLPETIEQRWCLLWVGYWFDESVCVDDVTITDIYYHTWVSEENDPYEPLKIAWGRTRNHSSCIESIDMEELSTIPRSTYSYCDSESSTSNNYELRVGHFDSLDAEVNFSDNSIYEMIVYFHRPLAYPSFICGPDVPSFVIFNLPSNATLLQMDTDGDNLSDLQELFGEDLLHQVTHTSPFLKDTDNDGYDDDVEYNANTDPNDPEHYPNEKIAAPMARAAGSPGLQLRIEQQLQAGTTVSFSLSITGPVDLSVFDVQGRVVRKLARKTYNAGEHSVTWDGHDATGHPASNGVYFFTLNAANQQETIKIILTR